MGEKLQNSIEQWKKRLLDLGKRNRLVNFRESKRSSVKITSPSINELWKHIVINEKELVFPYAKLIGYDDEGKELYERIINGDAETNKPIEELQKTLKVLRSKANTSIDEQGINTLYLTFGMLNWKERDDSSILFSSPIILVPVKLLIESITSPYRLVIHDDEIVINPTLAYKLYHDFGINFPGFDSEHDSPSDYISKISHLVENKDWNVELNTHLTNLSFLKINMYKDLDNNEEKINTNPVIAALVGEQEAFHIPEELNNFDHDKQTRPINTFQVLDADSSQQDAILLSKKGISFVLQGPPGTGKSQTITNIIAEAIANDKKVLFVSEKMAALQVVYNRLANIGLSDFCLTLHSHKAKKKEILNDLANSINVDHKRVKEEAIEQLNKLERTRNLLNEYQEELHTPTSGLNISIYSVNGKLAKLENVPDIVFSIDDTKSVTKESLDEKIYLLDELSKTIGKRSEDYADNVWQGSSIKFLTNSLRHEIDSKVTSTIPLLRTLAESHSAICSELKIELTQSLKGVDDLLTILSSIAKYPTILKEWINDLSISYLKDCTNQYKEQAEQIINIKDDLRKNYLDAFFNIDADSYYKRIFSLMHRLQGMLNDKNAINISFNINKIAQEINQIHSEFDILFEEAKTIASKLGISAPNTIEQLKTFTQTIQALDSIHKLHPTQKWFNNEELTHIKTELKKHEYLHVEALKSKKTLLSFFDKEIIEWDFIPVLQRFRGEYTSAFRMFKSQYRKDRKQLNSFLSNCDKLSYKDLLELLNKLKSFSDIQETINANKENYIETYGKAYVGLNTQWDNLRSEIAAFEQSISSICSITAPLKEAIIQGQLPVHDFQKFISHCSHFNIESSFELVQSILKCDHNTSSDWNEIKSYLKTATTTAEELYKIYSEILELRKESCDYESINSDIGLLKTLNNLEQELSQQHDTIIGIFKNYYNGINTDWDKLNQALEYAIEFKELISSYNLSESFVNDICEDRITKSYCQDKVLAIGELKAKLQQNIDWFTSLFDDKEVFYEYDFQHFINRMSECKDNKHLLEEWVDYCSVREKCDKAGLGKYVNLIKESDVEPNYIADIYLKRFYNLWLDEILPEFPAVQNFRGRNQSQNINEFCELDTRQLTIAQARIRERVLSKIPDFNSINEARGEISILKRELNKQRRLMPLRKLFSEIPNLLTSLRPCFMMSPLSVSVFLEAKSYDFDMVIFDEASQVHTEDAIGAIMRGRQVIIVGDVNQLPPTNFFLTSLNDEDYDVDSDESTGNFDAGSYESILEEAMTVLPERSLRWHYRSRNEGLISFSNIKIYQSQLITFPSSIEHAPDFGVEYVYVKDGVYDRGGKKNNTAEANKVADLVFEHIRKHPDRSLGVVTFSEAQQYAIDLAIRNKRLKNPRYDSFFNEDKDEPFFIKNLENVQGDERDTIIFSIGYAKDKKGIMYMNFGPLSREGGYRRLNVAITRAKFNVKLVGSIVPTDIDLEKVSSEGVKMLRSYIEYAQLGIKAIEKEVTFNYDLNFDSPFEESVYDFLQSKHYTVISQVGCSGFRIDMAIKNPDQSGRFAIGIECDGATYHSSRTARERDRLRQTILEDMGWTIYRIWSTDWIKDPKSEKIKLISAIEKALGHYPMELNDTEIEEMDEISHNEIPEIEIEEEIESSIIRETDYGFELYEQVSLKSFYDEYGNIKNDYEIALEIITLEQPIHFDELSRRIAPAYGRQKATSYVKEELKHIIRSQLYGFIIEDSNGFVRLNDFIELKVRIPNPNDSYVRPFCYICDEELALAMKTIAQHSFGITPEELFIVTAKEFGYKRMGDNILNSLNRVYQSMLKNNDAREVNGKVSIDS